MNRAGRLNASNDLANTFNTIVCVPQCAAARVSTWVSKLIVPAALRPIRGRERHIIGIPDVVPASPAATNARLRSSPPTETRLTNRP